MTIAVLADFSHPLSWLLSQRADALTATTGVQVRWCAVQTEPSTFIGAQRLSETQEHQLVQRSERLALPSERRPRSLPSRINSRAATAAYAEAVDDDVHPQLRRALFEAVYVHGRDLSDAAEVRSVVASVMLPASVWSPERSSYPRAALAMGAPSRSMRQLGGTITRTGDPVTVAGYRRLVRWREQWTARAGGSEPLLLTPLGEALHGELALRWMAARLGTTATAAERAPSGPTDGPGVLMTA